jgi:hypothetical protein
MNKRKSVTIDSDRTIIIDDPELEFALHELARRWNVPVERALALAFEQALTREGAPLD